MPSFPIVDTHLHIWDPKRLRYPWLAEVPFLNKPYLIDGYREACGEIEVEKMVFVQAEADFSQYREETAWVSDVAKEDPRIQGIVSWAPLEKGNEVASDLEALSANPLVKSIRRIIQFEPDPEFCLRPDFIRGVQLLHEFDLAFDICINHTHLYNTIRMVEQCPDERFILDHIGKPDIKNRLLDPWREQLKRLAEFPNVSCKVSGLVTEADHASWKPEDLQPYIEHVLDCFGFNRIMYGGDWPVAYQATEYPRWVETLESAIGGSPEQQRKLFRENAIDFYRIL